MATWVALVLGVAAVHDGRLEGVMLAVVALVPLAAFELVAPLPVAAQALEGARSSAARLASVMDAPSPVVEPAIPSTVRSASRHGLRIRGVSSALHARRSAGARRASTSTSSRAAALPSWGRVAPGSPRSPRCWRASSSTSRARFSSMASSSRELSGEQVRNVVGLVEQDAHIFDSTLRENLRLAKPGATDPRAALCTRAGAPG